MFIKSPLLYYAFVVSLNPRSILKHPHCISSFHISAISLQFIHFQVPLIMGLQCVILMIIRLERLPRPLAQIVHGSHVKVSKRWESFDSKVAKSRMLRHKLGSEKEAKGKETKSVDSDQSVKTSCDLKSNSATVESYQSQVSTIEPKL